jgi:hypothetical protein
MVKSQKDTLQTFDVKNKSYRDGHPTAPATICDQTSFWAAATQCFQHEMT